MGGQRGVDHVDYLKLDVVAPRWSKSRWPPPNSTGTRWIAIWSTSPALMNCRPRSAPPITATFLPPATSLALPQGAFDPVRHKGVDAALGHVLERPVGVLSRG